MDPLRSFFFIDEVELFEGLYGVGKNYGVNTVLAVVVAVKGLIRYGLADHVGGRGRKMNRQFDVNVGAEGMTGAVDAVF